MMTSNRPLEDWGKLIGDVPSATAILDRFLHHAEIDHRQELSPARPRGRRPPPEQKTVAATGSRPGRRRMTCRDEKWVLGGITAKEWLPRRH